MKTVTKKLHKSTARLIKKRKSLTFTPVAVRITPPITN